MAPSSAKTNAPKTRDAERSRALILAAAEQRFATLGFDATTLADIGDHAGLSRGTPSYFFGSKDELYVAVLERAYQRRNEALEPAFKPLTDWANADKPTQSLSSILTRSVGGYLQFLHDNPAFVDIMEREALAGGNRLRTLENESTVMEDAFGALRRRARAHGLKNFDVNDVVTTLVALAFFPVAHRHTMLRRQDARIDDPRFQARRKKHIVAVLLSLVGA